MTRPGPLRWLGYAFGARLPTDYGPWVLHDLTARTWFLRQAARVFVQAAPLYGVLLVIGLALVPVPWWTVVLVLTLGLAAGMFHGLSIAPESCEVHLVKHGFRAETGREMRARRRARGRRAR